MDWKEELLEYKSYLFLAKKLSINSIEAYMADIERFSEYITEHYSITSFKEIDNFHIEQFFLMLSSGQLCNTSQSRKISGLKSFFVYMMVYGKIESSPMDKIESPKISRKVPETLSIDELKLIFKVAKKNKKWTGVRNIAILDTLYSTGLRVSELINLKTSDIFPEDEFIRVIGKGNKERLVPINKDTLEKIRIYRSEIDSQNDILFLNNRMKQLTREMIFTIIKKTSLEAGIARPISPHTFRHTFATHLITAGVDIRLVQDILGHENIVTTEIYTHLDTSYKRQVLEQKHPLSIMDNTNEDTTE